MSQKPQPQRDEEKNKRTRKKKSKQTITRAVPHIRLSEANPGKLAALNVASRWGDQELAACQKKDQIKALLLKRHEECKQLFGLAVVQPAVQLGLWDGPLASTDVA